MHNVKVINLSGGNVQVTNYVVAGETTLRLPAGQVVVTASNFQAIVDIPSNDSQMLIGMNHVQITEEGGMWAIFAGMALGFAIRGFQKIRGRVVQMLGAGGQSDA